MTTEIATKRTWIRRNGWTGGVWVLLFLLFAYYSTLLPSFGAFQITSLAKNSLPLVFLAIAQAIVVIGGGIDLGLGAILLLTTAVASQLMEGQSFGMTLVIALVVILLGAAIEAGVGWVVAKSKIPDIVVTLATLFIFSGVALLVLPSPGGGTSPEFRAIFTGSVTGTGTNFWPSLVAIAIPTAAGAVWLRRTRPGLSVYALGSDRNAAYLSAIDTTRAKVISYAAAGVFGALAGLSALAITGSGESRFATATSFTLRSVAAIVLGGIALTGGIGSVVGAAAAGIILFALSPILSAMGFDPNAAEVIQGVLIIVLMMVAGIIELRRQRAK